MGYILPIEVTVHKSDEGTKFDVKFMRTQTAALDVSDATVKVIKFKPPDSATMQRTADFVTDGTDGLIRYISLAGEIAVVGEWQIQGYIETPDGKWHSQIRTFEVEDNL